MRQADWTPSPRTERETVRLRRRARWGRLHLVGAGVSSLAAMVGGIGLTHALAASSLRSVVLALTTILASGAALAWLAVRDRALRRDVAQSDEARRQEFGNGAGWPIDLTILQGDAPSGGDRGMLWIESGRLLFAGDRTSFALGPHDLAGNVRSERGVARLRRTNRLPLAHRTAAGPLALSFDLVNRDEEERIVLREALLRWAERAPRLDGQLPPTRIGPGSPPRPRLLLDAAWTTAYWAGIGGLALETTSRAFVPGAMIWGLGLLVGWAFGWNRVGLRWRAWRDLGKVERERSEPRLTFR